MLEHLELHDVGPAAELEVTFRERVNLFIGDSGLGKSLLLDVAWWALTGTWAGPFVVPHLPPAKPEITYSYAAKAGGAFTSTSTFDRDVDRWLVDAGRSSPPGLVIYARADGGFASWDPARNSWENAPGRPLSYPFTAEEVWQGNERCEGIIRDWANWQREGGEAFVQLESVLRILSPPKLGPLASGKIRKIFRIDPKRYPTLKMPYDQEVAIVHASAGTRRMLALAYLLVWTWQEHLETAKLRGHAPSSELVLLVDELEAHLDPEWQRQIVGALLNVMEAVTGDRDAKVQLIATTHSRLVLKSVEPFFDTNRDGIFQLVLRDREVTLEEVRDGESIIHEGPKRAIEEQTA